MHKGKVPPTMFGYGIDTNKEAPGKGFDNEKTNEIKKKERQEMRPKGKVPSKPV